MAKYVKNPVVVEAITFDELVEYGKDDNTAFAYKGNPVTRGSDSYLIMTWDATLRMTSEDMLVWDGVELYTVPISEFKRNYTFCI